MQGLPPEVEAEFRRAVLVGGVAAAMWSPVGGQVARSCGVVPGIDTAATIDANFYAASIAKQVTAVLAAQLVVAGDLRVQDRLAAYLPGLPSWAHHISVDQLIHHTSGLPSTEQVVSALGVGEEHDLTNQLVLTGVALIEGPSSAPGELFAYSNIGYVLLAEIIRVVSGTELSELARRKLFEPLAMTATQLCRSRHDLLLPDAAAPPGTVGDGGLWTSPADLLRWLRALNIGEFGEGVTELIHTPGHLTDGSSLPYCWGMTARPGHRGVIYTHGGSWPGWVAKTVRNPTTGTAVALMSAGNNDTMAISELGMALHARLVDLC